MFKKTVVQDPNPFWWGVILTVSLLFVFGVDFFLHTRHRSFENLPLLLKLLTFIPGYLLMRAGLAPHSFSGKMGQLIFKFYQKISIDSDGLKLLSELNSKKQRQEKIVKSYKGVAFFDFDGTLIRSDSLLPFLAQVAGWPPVFYYFFSALVLSFFQCDRTAPTGSLRERRTFIKNYLLQHVLAGRCVEDLDLPLARLAQWPTWKQESLKALYKHYEDGYKIVIASGSLDLYLKSLLKNIPYDDIICTEMEVIDGVLTGAMLSGNCVRKNKAERVQHYLDKHGPFEDSWAYGNAPHDLPMMELVRHRIII